MINKGLDDFLDLLRGEKLPAPPSNLEANVFRMLRLRRAETESEGFIFKEVFGVARNPGFVATVLALVVATSAITTAIATEFSNRSQALPEAPAWAVKAIDIELFNHSEGLLDCCRPSVVNQE